MGAYLDRLNDAFDTITDGIDEILNRAADENRDVTKEEAELVEREQKKADDLKTSIDHYSAIEKTRTDVEAARSKMPTRSVQRTAERVGGDGRQVVVVERSAEDQLAGMFPSAGDYIVTVGRALRGDSEASQVIERAQELYRSTELYQRETQHQTTADNPGLLPRPILGSLITLIDGERPFINSITRAPLPTGSFDRPKITQHVGVGKQAKEKDQTESRKMIIGKLPVEAETYAGHLNISRQDIKWTSPGIMQIVANDFAIQYALETEEDAEAQFLASIDENAPIPIASWDPGTIRKALFAAAVVPITNGQPLGRPNTLWFSADVWAAFGGLVNDHGVPVFPNLSPGDSGAGDVAGFTPVLCPWFPAGTAILGPSRVSEWYEDLDGLIQVAEPDVLGQLVGYAGFGAFLNTEPDVYSPLQLPPIDDGEETVAAAKESAKATSSK